MKYYHKRREYLYIKYWDVNNLYRWEMTQKLIVDISKWLEETSQFNEGYIKTTVNIVMRDIFLKFMFNIVIICLKFMIINLFHLKEQKPKKLKIL